MSNILEIKNLAKSYQETSKKLQILKEVNLALAAGDNLALVGPSGCGKTTLLQILGLLDTPTKGQVIYNGRDLAKAKESEQTLFRRKNIGFIYQFHHLMPEFTALENTMLPLLINRTSRAVAIEQATKMLKSLKLGARLEHKPSQLSGGEKQRVAIARALIHQPQILLADEPTGNLDPENAELIFDLLLAELKERKQTTIIVTHNETLAKKLDRAITIQDGTLVPL